MNILQEKIKRILSTNLFMTLATSSIDGKPWSTPVFYAIDDGYNFYWYSQKATRHSQNIIENKSVSASIFATSGENEGVGVYIEGAACELAGNELEHATKIYAAKAAGNDEEKVQLTEMEDFLGEAPLRMYKLTPNKIYISGTPTKWNGKWMDVREEVEL